MVIEIQSLHYGHSDGHTYICYSADGEKLISCGGDGDVRIWNGFDDDDPLQTCLGEFVLCIKHKNEHLLAGTDNNSVQLVSYPSGEREGILTRFTGHVNHMAVGESHNWVALASEDMTVKVIELTSKETKTFSDLKGPPLSVALCPEFKLLAISCGDGRLLIYNLKDQSIVKELPVVPKANSFMNAKLLCRTDFDQKHNKYFIYPDGNKILVLNVSDWSEVCSLTADEVKASFSIASFSHCGNYIAGVTLEGDLAVWNLRSQCLVGSTKHQKGVAITSIAWNPKGNGDLAFGDIEGYVGLAIRCTNSESLERPVNDGSTALDVMEEDDAIDFGDIQIEEDDEDNENAISLEKLKKEIMGTESTKDEDEQTSSRSSTPTQAPQVFVEPLQQAFMPSSTPEHLDPRYMCWNEVAVVRCYGSSLDVDDEGTRSIEVEFHDSSLHSSMMMSNYHGYTMGSISTAALAVAHNNVINVVPLGSSSKEWHLNIPDDQQIVAIATSHNLVCLATAANIVNVCTIYGSQKAVLSVPGPVLCMTAFGHVLMVAYHAASTRGKEQCVDIMLIKMEGTSVENRNIKAALTPGSKLQWLGFTDSGSPALMDSEGMIFIHPLTSNLWIPFCDTYKQSKSPADGFFVTAIYETFGTVRGIRCKGSMYPGFTPRPAITEIDLQAPFAELDTEKSQMEADLFKWSTLQVENTDKKYKETALKTFALAAKNNLDQRALEFIEMLGNSQVMTLAVKYASKLDKRRLAEKLMEVASKLDKDDGDIDGETSVNIATPNNAIKPNKKLFLNSTNKILSRGKSQVSTPTQNSPAVSTNNETFQESLSTPMSSKLASTIDSQSLSILKDEPRNPFLKSLKKPKASAYNPLSLTDKFAGIETESKEKENEATSEKRKKPDTSPVEKSKEKQRKLDRFMFSKRT